MRLFFAVELAPVVREAAAGLAKALGAEMDRAGGLDARWIPEENLHVTLWFLGEVPAPRLDTLAASLTDPFPMAPFSIEVTGLGAFPPSGPPRVIWAGIAAGADGLRAVHARLAVRLGPLGYEPERRPFHPHVTVARVRRPPGRQAAAALRRLVSEGPATAGASLVDGVTLFQSRPTSRGSSYDAVLRVPLTR